MNKDDRIDAVSPLFFARALFRATIGRLYIDVRWLRPFTKRVVNGNVIVSDGKQAWARPCDDIDILSRARKP